MANAVDMVIASKAIEQVQNLIEQLTLADAELLKVSQSAINVSKNIALIKTPSSLDDSTSKSAALSAELAKQNRIINTLELQISKLKEAKLKLNSATLQQKVDARIVLQNATAEAKATSTTASAYQRLDFAHKQASRSAQDIGAKYGATSRQFKNAADKANVLDRELKKIDATLGKSQRNVGNYSSAFGGVSSALGAFGIITGVAGVALLAKSAFETTKDLQSLNMALLAVTGSQEEFSKQQSFLARVAEVYGVEIKGLTSQFTAFYVAANGKIEGKEIQTIFENISKSGAALGVNTETLKRAFVALTQMLSKGKVASEELRRQLAEALPGSVQAMTRAVQILNPELKNLNEEGLFKMIENGKILAEEVLPETSRQLLILVGADKVEGIDTITKTTNRFLNAWTRMVDSINNSDSSGFSLFVKSIVEGLTNILDFTGLLFKDENQLTDYFQKLGAAKGVNEYKAILNNISGATVEQQEITKKALLERERETIRVNQQIVKDEKQKRASILGGNRAFLHLQTKMEEDAIVQIGNSAAIIKAINEEKLASNTKILKTTTALTKEQLSDRAKAEEERLKDLFKLSQAQVELQIELSEKEVDNDLNSFASRYKAFKDFSANRLILLRLNYSEEIRLAKGNKTKLEIAEVDFNKNTVKEKTALSNTLQKIREDEHEQNLEIIKQIEKDIEEKNARVSKIEQAAAKASFDLIDKQIEKLNELKRATDNYIQSFSSEFASNLGFSETFDTFFREIKDVDGNVTTLFEDLLKGAEGSKGSKEEFAVYFNAIAQSAQEAFNFIADISQGNFDKEKQRLQDQYDLAIVFAGDSSTAKAKLAEDLERKQKEIANRENKAKQKQALFNIAIDTAQGIVAALKIGVKGIPLAVIIGALGAVQLAVVASQKIPQYAEGTSNHAGGPMIVNDGPGSNFAEKVITPDGKIFSPQGRNVLMNAPKGTKVLNHEQQIHEMLNERGVSMNHTHTSTGMTAQEMDGVMGKHFAKIQTNTTIFDKKGIREYTESNGNRTIRDHNRVSKTGFRV